MLGVQNNQLKRRIRMTPVAEMQNNLFRSLIEAISREGFDGMAQVFTLLMNEVMKAERSEALAALPYERTDGTGRVCQRLQAEDD
jgi:hypothetical protein